MGDPNAEWWLPELTGLTRETGIALLDRAAEVGLLTELGDRLLSHPSGSALVLSPLSGSIIRRRVSTATRGVRGGDGAVGNYYHRQYDEGKREVMIGALTAEETNLLCARSLARSNGWWHRVIGTMQGLRLYGHTGRPGRMVSSGGGDRP